MLSDKSSELSAHNLHGTFVSQKINKIRWKPERMEESHFFVTGSVDCDENKLTLWDLFENQEEDDIYPFTVSEYPYCGDVTEIKFLSPDHFACCSSSGSAHLMSVVVSQSGEYSLQNYITWKDIHYFRDGEPSPCTALAGHGNDLVTVGEDGRINVLTAQSTNVVRSIENADSCSIQCVTFLKHNEVLTSNLRGQLKIWDLKSGSNKPSGTFMLSGDQVTATYLTFHPTQRHIIIAGDELGALTTWDLRHNTFPINVLNAHEGAISEIQFHPDNPENLFSCSSSGELWHWFTKSKYRNLKKNDIGETNVWLASDNIKSKMDVLTLMPTLGKPINTLDVNRNKVICGCDNEAIYLINGVNV